MSKIRKLKLRTISLILTFAMIMGCVCNTVAAAETGSEYADHLNGNSIERVYDSGNVILFNQVETDKKNDIFTVKLKVKVGDIAKLPFQTDSISSTASVKDSSVTDDVKDSSAIGGKAVPNRKALSLRMAVQQEETPYEVRYYIQPNFEVVGESVTDGSVLEENGQYVSWPGLTAKNIATFSTNIKLQPKTTEDIFCDSNINTDNKSGVYQDGEPVYLFAQPSAEPLPPIAKKTAKLANWADRTYDINLNVTAQSQIQTSTVPCDIILVLDRSGSMGTTYLPITGKPDTSYNPPQYYIDVNGTYIEVFYYGGNWYYKYYYGFRPLDFMWIQVYPSTGGVGDDRNYQFYTKSSQTKLEALKTAANQFVTNVVENSPDSRIAVVSYATDVSDHTGGFLPAADTNVNSAINSLSPGGATHAYDGMQMAREIFDDDTMDTAGRSRAVIMFTDGEPGEYGFFDNRSFNYGWQKSGFKAASSTINESEILKAKLGQSSRSDLAFHVDNVPGYVGDYYGTSAFGKGCGATVYTIGVFSELNEQRLELVNSYMQQVASSKDKYYPVSDANALNDVFKTISNEVGGISGVTVTDVIDPRFNLLDADGNAIDRANTHEIYGGKASYDSKKNVWKIIWRAASIGIGTWENGKIKVPGWEKTIHIQAKDQFIGGNAIPTNMQASSGVAYGSGQFEKFPQPTVNVKPVFYVGNAESTVFYGESVPTTTLNKYAGNDNQDSFCGQDATGNFVYQWFKADGTTQIGSEEAFPASQLLNSDTHYTLKAKFKPFEATGESNKNSTLNKKVYKAGETENTVVTNSAEGKYIINVIKGELNISKNIDKKHPAPAEVNAKQSFVFKIERRDTQGGAVADTFYEVITLSDALRANKTITGLKKGYYKVTEETGDAWRYTQRAVNDNDDSISDAGTVFIGRDTTEQGEILKSYFGAGENIHGVKVNPATVTCNNQLKNNRWLGDTTVVVNTITH